eukprot:GHVN01024533.1.p3 GENE.GHVN01024533.1~~GHVN01024533.1.p3  ORF type:complete len:134 (-),score=10.19 GHVN01024533.1:276-677(-)
MVRVMVWMKIQEQVEVPVQKAGVPHRLTPAIKAANTSSRSNKITFRRLKAVVEAAVMRGALALTKTLQKGPKSPVRAKGPRHLHVARLLQRILRLLKPLSQSQQLRSVFPCSIMAVAKLRRGSEKGSKVGGPM